MGNAVQFAADWPEAHAKCCPVPLSEVAVSGYLGRCVDRNLASVMAALNSAIPRGFEARAAGRALPSEADRLAADSDLYKWLEGACYVYARTHDPELKDSIGRISSLIRKCQEPDGYINTQSPPLPRFDSTVRHDLYIAGHFCEAAAAHQRATGSQELVNTARRWVDYLMREYENGHPYFRTFALMDHSEYEIGFLRLYRATGERKYLDFAITLALDLCRVGPTVADIRDGSGLHAVRVGYLLAGRADLYLETGRDDLLQYLCGLWRELAETRMYITGGMGSHGEHISKKPYDLPHTQDHLHRTMGETCSSVAMMMLSWRMHSITGHSGCFDVIETILYNHYLGALALNGMGTFYYNPLRVVGDQDGRTDHWHTPPTSRCMLPNLNRTSCCMPNHWRFLGALPEYVFSYDADGLFVNLYTSSRVEHTPADSREMNVSVETCYPHDGRIVVRYDGERPSRFSLRLRVPRWCNDAVAAWPGQEAMQVAGAGYLAVDRLWRKGEKVELNLNMPPRMILPDPRIEANRGQVVFAMGPVLFCLESDDASFPVEQVKVDVSTEDVPGKVGAEWCPDLLGGITRLHLPGLVGSRRVDLVLIPWAVRANRGQDGRWIIFLPRA